MQRNEGGPPASQGPDATAAVALERDQPLAGVGPHDAAVVLAARHEEPLERFAIPHL